MARDPAETSRRHEPAEPEERPQDGDGNPLRGHEREHVPLTENRARKYTMLDGGITMGTICEYEEDGWTWVIVTDLPDKTWGDVFDEDDDRADEKVVRFLNLDKLTDSEFMLFEDCVGCYEHVDTARMFSDHDGAGLYIRRSDFVEKFRPLGPFHPDADVDDDTGDATDEIMTDGGITQPDSEAGEVIAFYRCIGCGWFGAGTDVEWGAWTPPGQDMLRAEPDKCDCPECSSGVEWVGLFDPAARGEQFDDDITVRSGTEGTQCADADCHKTPSHAVDRDGLQAELCNFHVGQVTNGETTLPVLMTNGSPEVLEGVVPDA